MNVHLIRTTGYHLENYNACLELLRSFSGCLNFQEHNDSVNESILVDAESFSFSNKHLSEKQLTLIESKLGLGVSWNTLFGVCRNFRIDRRIPEKDFVILLTEQKNEHNWFSLFDENRNVFIDCSDWDLFTDAPSKYPIVYEVVANVLRSLMNVERILPNPHFHDKARGCVNDFCAEKFSIMLKLRTADICESCIKKMHQEGVDERIIDQACQIFEGIRTQLLFRKGAIRHSRLSEIELSNRNKLYFPGLGNLELKLYPLYKTLYVFFLNHLEGVKLNELSDHRAELVQLYKKFSVADSNRSIEDRIADLINPFSGSFSQKKSHLNKKIENLLGTRMAVNYQISGVPGQPFKINLAPHQVVLPAELAKSYA